MNAPASAGWVPPGIFILLALYFLDKALRAGARRNWGWGRRLGAAPISRAGYAVIALTFLDIGAILAWAPRPPMILVLIFLACFVSLGVIGFRDTEAHRRQGE